MTVLRITSQESFASYYGHFQIYKKVDKVITCVLPILFYPSFFLFAGYFVFLFIYLFCWDVKVNFQSFNLKVLEYVSLIDKGLRNNHNIIPNTWSANFLMLSI